MWLLFLPLEMRYLSFLYPRRIINNEDIIYNFSVLVWGEERSASFISFTLWQIYMNYRTKSKLERISCFCSFPLAFTYVNYFMEMDQVKLAMWSFPGERVPVVCVHRLHEAGCSLCVLYGIRQRTIWVQRKSPFWKWNHAQDPNVKSSGSGTALLGEQERGEFSERHPLRTTGFGQGLTSRLT